MMDKLTRYKIPLLVGAGTLVVVLIVFVGFIVPEGHTLAKANAKKSQLQSQQAQLEVQLAALRRDKAQFVPNCRQLARYLAEIPDSPRSSEFLQQVTSLAQASGDPNTPSYSLPSTAGGTAGTGGVKPIQFTMTLAGTFGQMLSFVHGLDSPGTLPRLFTISSISIGGGPVASGGNLASAGGAGYTLSLSGAIYYASGQTNVCPPAGKSSG